MKVRNKKTGGLANILADEQDFIRVYTDAGWHDYDSVAEMMEEWEDYKPTEPLIKDEKIRKAVRAWANLYDNSAIRVHIGEDYISLFKDEINGYSSSVGIDLPPDVFRELIDAHYYNITELCGEEKK